MTVHGALGGPADLEINDFVYFVLLLVALAQGSGLCGPHGHLSFATDNAW